MIFLLTLLLGSSSPAATPTADALLSHWRNAIYTQKEHSHLKLSLVPQGGSPLVREADVWYKSKGEGDSRILIKFQSPASIRGVAFLSLRNSGQSGSDQWIYFPAYKKARRLSSQARDEAFLDSDFSNGDISFEYESSFQFQVKGTKVIDGKTAYVVEGIVKPAKAAESPFAKEVLYISTENSINLRSEFFDAQGSLAKVLTVPTWKKYGQRWTADTIIVENEKTKHRSELEFSKREIEEDPADRLFSLSALESGR